MNLVWGSQKSVAARRVDASRHAAQPSKQHVSETHVFDSKLENPYNFPKGFVEELGLGLPEVCGRAARRRAAQAPKQHVSETNVFDCKFRNPILFP